MRPPRVYELRMGWYFLRARRDVEVAADLSAVGIVAMRPEYRIEFWHPRKSVVVERTASLLPGHLLVSTPLLPVNSTRHSCDFLRDHESGRPLRVPEADALLERCARGEFDVIRHRGAPEPIPVGTAVMVDFLGLLGLVVECVRGICRVVLDRGGHVTVPQGGLSLA